MKLDLIKKKKKKKYLMLHVMLLDLYQIQRFILFMNHNFGMATLSLLF